MANQNQHELLVSPTHDEAARQEYYMDIRRHLARNVAGGNRVVWSNVVRPAFVKANGRDPESRAEVRSVMTRDPYYQMYSAMQRHTQEMTWDSVIDSVERELPALNQKAKQFAQKAKGSLTLTPDFEVPPYLSFYDIHLQPGGYHANLSDDDVSVGALYDRATFMYAMGNLGAKSDYLGLSLIEHFKKRFPHIKPKRILDMGCTTGNSAVPWKEAFPDAEVYGIDVGESVLRYAHARSESMGAAIHYSQQNAEHTNFPDGFFDVVVSHIIMHETSTPAVRRIFTESKRLLRDGGVMMHMDNPRLKELPPFDAFLAEWEVYNNNERFGGTYREMDIVSEAEKSGFAKGKATLEIVTMIAPPTVTNYTTKGFGFPCLVGEK